jgi:Fur family ferric uptake transcriptional regulator
MGRDTAQRRVILEELMKLPSHPTAAELYEIARRRLPRISLGTVYRNLEHLARAGQIRKLGVGPTEARFDADTSPHHHVRCVQCDRLGDVLGLPEDPVPVNPTVAEGYDILAYRLEFVGRCSQCRAEAAVKGLSDNAEQDTGAPGRKQP